MLVVKRNNHRNVHPKIYQSQHHLIVTLFLVALPFLFILSFAWLTEVILGKLFWDFLISFWRLFWAYLIAVALAWVWAVAFYRGRRAAVALPIFDVLQSFPTFAVMPLAVYFLGTSNFTIIFFLVISVVWPIFFSIISSLKLIKRDWQEAVEISRLAGWNYFKKFLWPVTVPGLITGSIIGLGEGWEALVATEIIVKAPQGLGNFFQSQAQNTTVTALGVLGFLLLIFSINKLLWLPLLEWSHRHMED